MQQPKKPVIAPHEFIKHLRKPPIAPDAVVFPGLMVSIDHLTSEGEPFILEFGAHLSSAKAARFAARAALLKSMSQDKEAHRVQCVRIEEPESGPPPAHQNLLGDQSVLSDIFGFLTGMQKSLKMMSQSVFYIYYGPSMIARCRQETDIVLDSYSKIETIERELDVLAMESARLDIWKQKNSLTYNHDWLSCLVPGYVKDSVNLDIYGGFTVKRCRAALTGDTFFQIILERKKDHPVMEGRNPTMETPAPEKPKADTTKALDTIYAHLCRKPLRIIIEEVRSPQLNDTIGGVEYICYNDTAANEKGNYRFEKWETNLLGKATYQAIVDTVLERKSQGLDFYDGKMLVDIVMGHEGIPATRQIIFTLAPDKKEAVNVLDEVVGTVEDLIKGFRGIGRCILNDILRK